MVPLSYLEDVVSDIVNLDDGWTTLAELGAEHGLKAWTGGHQHDLVSVEKATLDAELHVAQLGVVHELGVNPRASRGQQRRIPDLLDVLPAVARGEDVREQQRGALLLQDEIVSRLVSQLRSEGATSH